MTKVLVTGAAGFLGSHVVKELCRSGYEVRALLHGTGHCDTQFLPEVERVAADICDPKKIHKIAHGCEAVVHLAAKVHAIDDPSEDEDYQSINVEGTKRILDAAVSAGAKHLVFASSVKVFGEETSGCVDESQVPEPKTPYGRSKWRAEQLISEYAGRHGLIAVSLRLPMVYGPTKKGNLYRMIEAIDHGRFPTLPRLPAVRSLLHVENFVQAVSLCLRAHGFKRPAYIVADSEPYCVSDIYNWLRAGLGKTPPRWRVPLWMLKSGAQCGDVLQVISGRPVPLTTEQLTKLVGCAWYSSTTITHELGYHASYSFQKAVPELIAFYRNVAARAAETAHQTPTS
ncbi:NAD-dependent epimerase/dehydratase family protein [Nitrospira sp. BLG_2]|uniref:NAD-dependent epimerase/dehydratase family protein n=1 Tax=Nitrospira sp. BLG_2 TaxID=3397507 RepID=UPI003B99A6A1